MHTKKLYKTAKIKYYLQYLMDKINLCLNFTSLLTPLNFSQIKKLTKPLHSNNVSFI